MPTLAALCHGLGARAPTDGAAARARFTQYALGAAFVVGFAALAAKLLVFAANTPEPPFLAAATAPPPLAKSRPDIVDRHGRLLATDIRVYWLYANPSELTDADSAAEKAVGLFPDLDEAALLRRFRDKASTFEWVKRGLTPKQAQAVQNLGVPGFYLLTSQQRVYPAGNLAADILGVTDVDNNGLSGIEKYIDRKLSAFVVPSSVEARPIVKLSLDLGVQHAVTAELAAAKALYEAKSAMALILDVRDGEVLAEASLPDFDPNRRKEASTQNRNRVVTDDYELGSVFKTFTIAMALDDGVVTPLDRFDAITPLRIGQFLLRDPHATIEPMTVQDIYVHSSNTGAARIALLAGIARQRGFLKKLGLFDRVDTELGPSAKPLYPKLWRTANSITIAYGHGIAVPPILFAACAATLVNGGTRVQPTFLLQEGGTGDGERLISPQTSAAMRDLMRLVVERGTGRRAAVPGIAIGGKTGTALKEENGRYTRKVINSFLAVFPIDNPKYLLLVTLDEPKATDGKPDEAAWNAAPAAGAIIKRVAPMLDLSPARRFDEAAASPYEGRNSAGDRQISSRNQAHEARGSDERHPAYRRPQSFERPRDYGVDGR